VRLQKLKREHIVKIKVLRPEKNDWRKTLSDIAIITERKVKKHVLLEKRGMLPDIATHT
jgi:hypothetical protein